MDHVCDPLRVANVFYGRSGEDYQVGHTAGRHTVRLAEKSARFGRACGKRLPGTQARLDQLNQFPVERITLNRSGQTGVRACENSDAGVRQGLYRSVNRGSGGLELASSPFNSCNRGG
jgi:hypothetical protein